MEIEKKKKEKAPEQKADGLSTRKEVPEQGPEAKADIPKKEEKSKPSKPSKAVKITIDNDPQEVVQYDNDGVRLEFEHANGKFLRLPPEVTRSLSYENKQRYFVSKGMFEETLSFDGYDRRNFPPRQGFATATDRLSVLNKDPKMHYCWKRPDELRQAKMDGYRVAQDASLDTFNSEPSSTKTVGTHGQEELVLMEIPKEINQQQRAANKEKDQRRRKGVESGAVDDMIRSGGKPFIPKEE